MWANSILEWFIHSRLKQQSILTFSRAKIIVSTGVIAAGAVPLYAGVFYFLGHPLGALACISIGIFICLALCVLKFFGRINLAREIILTALYLGLNYLSYSEGGLITPATFWLILIPIMAVFLGGVRSGVIWLGLCIFTILMMYLLHTAHFIFPLTPVTNVLLLTALSIIGLTCIVMALIYYFEMAKIEGFIALQKAAHIIEEKNTALLNVNQELDSLVSRTNAILTAVADGIITTDSQGNIESYNHAIMEMFSYKNSDLLGVNLQKLFSCSQATQSSSSEYVFALTNILNTENIPHELIGFRSDNSSFPLELVISRIELNGNTTYICAIHDMTERKKTEDHLGYLAHHDHLTGLPNRSLYEALLNKAITHAQRTGKFFALFFLDVDYFKNVNDTLGHDIGDLLLREVATRISKCLRKGDTVARLGGDEFTIILDELTDIIHAAKIAQNILETLNEPVILNGYEILASASMGIAIYPNNGEDAATLTKHADMALYKAKEKGRNNYQFYNVELNTQSLSQITLENNLHHALQLNELQVHYQPQVDIKTNQVTGIEALARWYNPTLGTVKPDAFIPIAEKIGLIAPISEWVIKTACLQFQQWLTEGLVKPSLKISFNLSSAQLKQENLPAIINKILNETHTLPENIELELTETAILHDQKRAVTILKQLDNLGICISIDDFGTGYSSLSYLKRLPVHTLKIDKSFIQDLTLDKNNALIIKAIIALGHGLEFKVIAEGVETTAQFSYLEQNHCDQAQGYYISAPLSAESMTTFLNSRN